MGFDGSSIDGFTRLEESDMIAIPSPETFQLLPWRPSEQGVGRMFCDIQSSRTAIRSRATPATL